MLFSVFGWLAVLFGIWWALIPQALRGIFTRKIGWLLSLAILAMIFFPLIRVAAGVSGALGIAVAIVVCFLILSTAGAAVRALFERVPLFIFRGIGILNIIWGVWLLRQK